MSIETGNEHRLANHYTARLASDAPSGDDELDAHERVAASMDRLIAQSDGGKTIALEGRWGSGKSSVIRMLAKKCLARNTLVHQYDAWAHAGDPLRRAFLASLIDSLTAAGWLDDVAVWRAELDMLAGKRRESEKTTSPLLTTFGFCLAATLLLLPGGIFCFGRGAQALITAGSIYIDRWPLFLFWLGVTLCTAPIILCAGNIFYCKWKRIARPNYLAIALNKQTITEKTSINEDGDQSTIEFQRVFGGLVTAALSRSSARKLVLVIDNLDRIDVGDVANVWSLLQSFIDIPRFANESWHSRLWVIVPIASEVEKQSQDSFALKQFNSSFLDKVFQARFRLPPPILKKWRPYLEKRLHSSIIGLSESDCDLVFQMFLVALGAGELPTPRELVLFVNQLAIFAEQWGAQYPLSVGAAYILEKVDMNLGGLLMGDIPSPAMKRLVSVDLKAAYASIYFNTGDEADALDLLQRPLALRLLSEQDYLGIAQNLGVHASFSAVLQRVLSENLGGREAPDAGDSFAEILTVARSFDESVLLSASATNPALAARVQGLRGQLERETCMVIRKLGSSVRFAAGYAEIVGILLKGEQSTDVLDAVVDELTAPVALITVGVTLPTDNESQALYSSNTSMLLGMNVIERRVRSASQSVFVAASGLNFAKILDAVVAIDDKHFDLLRPLGGAESATHYLHSEIATGEYGEIDANIMRWLEAVGSDPVVIAVDALEGYSEDASGLSGSYVQSVTSAAIEFVSSAVGRTRVDGIPKSTKALRALFDELLKSEDFDTAAELLVLVAAVPLSSSPPALDSFFKHKSVLEFLDEPASSDDLLSSFKKVVANRSLDHWMFMRAMSISELRRLLIECLNPISVIDKILSKLSWGEVVRYVDLLSSSLSEKTSGVMDIAIQCGRAMSSTDGLMDEVLKSPNKWRWLSRMMVVLKGASDVERVTATLGKELESLSSQEWLSSTSSYTWRELAASQLHDLHPDFNLNSASDLVRHLFKLLAGGKVPVGWTAARLQSLFFTLRKSVQSHIGRDEAERIIASVPLAAKDYWPAVAPILDRWMSQANAYENLSTLIYSVISANDRFAINWIVSAIDGNSKLRKLISDDMMRRELHLRVREQLASQDAADDVKGALISLKNGIARCARSKRGDKRKRR